ncbi:putative ABC transporter permease protein YtcP [Vallitalea longa]|uniref:ABC transporter permease protein YtcP n=1 Tax=Vallitalea longa TaxID=2936439 RepID=A0A9W6DFK5_9FIRM|nr:carbohydrate ABC transporter permease [Vallitalea longa]GKX28804.1 putative ABC transporter permease protein YtcP [Vallitalea longa]
MKEKSNNDVLMGNSVSRKVFVTINTIFLILVTFITILPIIHIISLSFSSTQAAEGGLVGLLPVQFSLKAYTSILGKTSFYRSLVVSIKRVIIGVPFSLLCTILVAYPLSKDKKSFPARKIYVWFFIITMLFNGGIIPTYIIVKSTGIMNKLWALILPSAVSVFNILILMNFFRELPKELEEAALIDGAGHISILTRIFLPLAKPALATLVLFIFVFHWNSWFDGLMYINKIERIPLQTYLQQILTMPDTRFMTADQLQELGNASRRTSNAAQIIISTIPILIIYPFLQKYYTKGLVLGSVKS